MKSLHEEPTKPTAIDLFSGCGGLTLGLKKAGYNVIGAIEFAHKAQQTYKMNHPDVHLYESDIRNISANDILSDLNLSYGSLDLLAGCPPCQGFSRLRTRNGAHTADDPRNNLIQQFQSFIEGLLPKSVMMENVPALAKDQRFKELLQRLEYLGYKTTFTVEDAADFGVAQRRKRLILLASRERTPELAKKSMKRISVREVISQLPDPHLSEDEIHSIPENRSDAVKKIISLIPKNGGSRTQLPIEYQLPCHIRSDGFKDVYGRMAWDDVSPTITSGCINPSKGRFLHPEQNRTITLREASLLQGFPLQYRFDVKHGKEAIALMIGNALPPPFIMAHALALRGKHELSGNTDE